MPLHSYRKEQPNFRTGASKYNQRSEVILQLQEEPLTLWKLFHGLRNDVQELLTTSRLAGTLIPAAFILYGLHLLSGQMFPVIEDKVMSNSGYYNQGTTSLISNNHVYAKVKELSNPGAEYFMELQNDAMSQHVLLPDPVSNNYNGTFKITMENLGLYDLPVKSNVNSGVEEIYDQVLETGLAHMESTGLPISDVKNNIVIYGHSAGGNYFERSGDPAAAFSILNKTKLGDKVEVTINGENYKYEVTKTKIVKPDDVSIITGPPSSEQTLTLFTCYPPGNYSNRLVVVAKPVDM